MAGDRDPLLAAQNIVLMLAAQNIVLMQGLEKDSFPAFDATLREVESWVYSDDFDDMFAEMPHEGKRLFLGLVNSCVEIALPDLILMFKANKGPDGSFHFENDPDPELLFSDCQERQRKLDSWFHEFLRSRKELFEQFPDVWDAK